MFLMLILGYRLDEEDHRCTRREGRRSSVTVVPDHLRKPGNVSLNSYTTCGSS